MFLSNPLKNLSAMTNCVSLLDLNSMKQTVTMVSVVLLVLLNDLLGFSDFSFSQTPMYRSVNVMTIHERHKVHGG